MASIVLHVLIIALIVFVQQRDLRTPDARETRETITIGRLRIEAPRPRVRPRVAPARVAVARAAVVPPQPRALVAPSIALPRPLAPLRPRLAPVAPVAPAHVAAVHAAKNVASARRPRVAYVPPSRIAPAGGSPVTGRSHFDNAHLAAIERSLGDAIASDRRAINPLRVAAAAPAEPVHHGLDANAFTAGDRNHHGLCDPIRDWTADGYDWYYLDCNVRFSDGTYQRQSIPWPVRFKPNSDPFNGTGEPGPVPGPLPGWRLAAGAYISPEVRDYARSLGASM